MSLVLLWDQVSLTGNDKEPGFGRIYRLTAPGGGFHIFRLHYVTFTNCIKVALRFVDIKVACQVSLVTNCLYLLHDNVTTCYNIMFHFGQFKSEAGHFRVPMAQASAAWLQRSSRRLRWNFLVDNMHFQGLLACRGGHFSVATNFSGVARPDFSGPEDSINLVGLPGVSMSCQSAAVCLM